jgi:hypothetical protein
MLFFKLNVRLGNSQSPVIKISLANEGWWHFSWNSRVNLWFGIGYTYSSIGRMERSWAKGTTFDRNKVSGGLWVLDSMTEDQFQNLVRLFWIFLQIDRAQNGSRVELDESVRTTTRASSATH